MLPRILETEAMDTTDEAHDYDAIDHREVNRRFVDDFLDAWGTDPSAAEILDLGTGTARIPIELARRDPRWRVRAVDLAQQMLEVARRNVVAAALTEQIALERVDAKQLPFANGQFTAVISNSIVHHIPDPRPVLFDAARVVASGGLIFFRDLLRPTNPQELHRLVETYTVGSNDHQRQMFADSLHAALSLDELREIVVSHGFAPTTVQATSDRHWTWSARK